VAWIVKLVKIGAGGEEEVTDILKIERPGDLDAAGLGLTSAEASLLLAGMQREIMNRASEGRQWAVLGNASTQASAASPRPAGHQLRS
jgi:hypothetical protein